jgi:phosphoribosyl 1,2-cyclic phosphodiesterase
MNVTFWGVRGSIPAPGPATVRYGGNTSCISIETHGGALLILDCGTGARNLGNALLSAADHPAELRAAELRAPVTAAILLSHTHWDHIQGFPFFAPFYLPQNHFLVYGPADSSALLEGILERQMAPQYFPVQTLKNMGARIDVAAVAGGQHFDVLGCRVSAILNPHCRLGALAFRIEDGERAVVYASDVSYGTSGPSSEALALYRGADLLIHDSTFTPEDRLRYPERGLSSADQAVAVAVAAGVRKLVLFHYDQDYTDTEIDALVVRARQEIASSNATLELAAAIEGATIYV